MDPKQALLEHKEKVDVELKKYLIKKYEEYSKVSDFAAIFFQTLQEFIMRKCKRLRPAFVYYSYSVFSDERLDEVIKTSIFAELIQTFLLIHDDIFDHAEFRRGKESVHKIFENYALSKEWESEKHFGTVMGILNGDVTNQLAYEVVANSNFDPEKRNEVIRLISEKVTEVQFGQVQDFILQYKSDYTENDIILIDIYKTASYTYELPIISGGILAGASKEEITRLKRYATPAGIAFQIRDDILGMFGDEKKLGKKVSSDIREGKKTLLIQKAYENGNKDQKIILDENLGNKDLTIEGADAVRKVVKETGALECAKKKCKNYVEEARNSLNELSQKDTEGWKFLDSIAEYMIVREY